MGPENPLHAFPLRFVVDAEVELGGTLQLPPVCPSQRERSCKSAVFKHLEEVQLLTNYQELRVQEKMQCLAMGALPKSIVVVVRDDLVDRCCTGGVWSTEIGV